MTIKEIRELSGLNLTDFSKKYHIPYRSLQNWERGERECPVYLTELLEFKVRSDLKES